MVVSPGVVTGSFILRHLVLQHLQLFHLVRVLLLTKMTARELERLLEHAGVGLFETIDFTNVLQALQRVDGGDVCTA